MRISKQVLALLCGLSMTALASAQAPDAQRNVTCTFKDGRQISIRYTPVLSNKKLEDGHTWTPGKNPAYLFSQAEITVGDKTLPPKAYGLYFIPDKKGWTFVVNENVSEGAAYSASQDLVRAPMEMGKLPRKEARFKIDLGHIAPKVCSLRAYYGDIGTWITLTEK